MSDHLLVGTRKGLFELRRSGRNWTIFGRHFLGEPVSSVLRDPKSGQTLAALTLGHFGAKLWRRDRDGGEWKELPSPVYPAKPADSTDKQEWNLRVIWVMEGGSRPGLVWAGTLPGGLFRSADGGDSWELVRTLWDDPRRLEWEGGGYDYPGIHSICVDPRNADRLVLGVSTGGVWVTSDGAKTWSLQAKGMYATYMPPNRREDPIAQDAHRIVQCPAAPDVYWCQHHNGVFRSIDNSQSWQDIQAIRPSTFGFAVAVHPQKPDTAWFVPAIKDEKRVPVDGKFVVARTEDGGKSSELLTRGLPTGESYDLVYRHSLAVDADGRTLAMGSTTGGLWTSDDGGDSWTALDARLPQVNCVRFA